MSYLGSEDLAGKSCYQFELRAKNRKLAYSLVRLWVDPATKMPVKKAFYAVSGMMLKYYEVTGVELEGGRARVDLDEVRRRPQERGHERRCASTTSRPSRACRTSSSPRSTWNPAGSIRTNSDEGKAMKRSIAPDRGARRPSPWRAAPKAASRRSRAVLRAFAAPWTRSSPIPFRTRTRPTRAFRPYSNASAFGQIEGKLSFSRDYTSLGLLDFTLRDSALLSLDGTTLESLSLTVNEFYSDLNFGDLLYLRLGKQRLSWGAGYVFNPSDPVNPPKNPTDQRAILEGVPALKAELIAKPVSLMAFAVLYDDFTQTGYGAKLSTSAVKNSDLSLSGYWSPSQSWTVALNASTAPFYDFPGWDTIQLWFEGSVYDARAVRGLRKPAACPARP